MLDLKTSKRTQELIVISNVMPKQKYNETQNLFFSEVPKFEDGIMTNELRLQGTTPDNKVIYFTANAYTHRNPKYAKDFLVNGKYQVQDCVLVKKGEEMIVDNDNNVSWKADKDMIIGGTAIFRGKETVEVTEPTE